MHNSFVVFNRHSLEYVALFKSREEAFWFAENYIDRHGIFDNEIGVQQLGPLVWPTEEVLKGTGK
jgi:hypothetical protein